MRFETRSVAEAHEIINVLDLNPSQREVAHDLLNGVADDVHRMSEIGKEQEGDESQGYEFKTISIDIRPSSDLLFLAVETGLKGDEGTLASILGRDRYHWMIRERGGLRALNRDGEWVDGRKARYTLSR
jgi:hypothetical protein